MSNQSFEAAEFLPALSRRSLFRGGGYLAAGAAMASLPMGRSLLAHDVAEAWPNVAALANKYVSERKVANMFLTFGWRQEDHAHTVGGGKLSLAGGADVDENSLYRIYSMSKPITGMAIMILIDQGKLGLDMPVSEILPAYKDMEVLVDPEGSLDNTVKAESPITIRQLLTHTAGLGYGITSKGELLDAYNENGIVGGRVSRMPIPGIPTVTPAPGLEAWADRLAELPLMYQPATKWSYSCSIDLLGRVIEVASGMEFETFLKTTLFEPLGMNSTWMTVPDSEKGRLTDNYGIVNGNAFPIDPAVNSIYLDAPKVPAGGGGLVSSPKDYDRFLRMLLGYGKLGKERVMSELAVRVGVSNLLPKTVDLTGSWMEGQGHGAGGRSHNNSFGWGGAAGTLGAVDYSLNLRTALWTQYMPSDAYPIRDEYMAALEADLKGMRGSKAA
ncbi:MAG: serine hydrolase domain-containing protein [Pseudomonadota bacterium]